MKKKLIVHFFRIFAGTAKMLNTVFMSLFCAGLIGIIAAKGGNCMDYYVSPDGLDTNAGTIGSPFKTIAKARDVVRTVNSSMSGNINVYLRGGWHVQTSALTFNQGDSGTNGYNVVYQAYGSERPVISGGIRITGWTIHDSGKNIWKANASGLNTRQLYVNCVRAVRAHKGSGLPGAVKTTAGYTTSDTSIQNWGNITDIEFVFNGNNGGIDGQAAGYWVEWRIGVAGISGTSITMKNPAWTTATTAFGVSLYPKVPTDIENAYELLDQAGEFYLNRSQGVIYYIPRPGENLSTAVVIAPVLETLVSGSGVSNVQFKGITFAHATWLRPGGNSGFIEHQANELSPEWTFNNGNIRFQSSSSLRFERCMFKHLGSIGLWLDNGCQSCVVNACVFTDISGNGVLVGNNTDPAGNSSRTTGNQIINCYVNDIGCEYHGGVGIIGVYFANTLISHNEIAYTPYSGISIGWGWGQAGYIYNANNQVTYNYIHHPMRMMSDGGCIYTLGDQPGSKINNNWLDNMPARSSGGSLYPDQSSKNIEIYNNVCSNVGYYWLFLNSVDYVNLHDNYTNTTTAMLRPGYTATVANTMLISGSLSNWPSAAQNIANNAGIESAYSDIKTMACACSYGSTPDPDTTPPSAPGTVRDGTGTTDTNSTTSTAQLSANWTAATDAESGISNYQYAIGLTPGGSETAGWTTIGNVLTVTKTGLSLTVGTTYYFSVRAVSAGGTGTATNSNGQVVLQQAQELIGHWKLDETSGSSAVDSSGKGNTGTLAGSPAWVPSGGKIGGSLSFDGTDDYISYGSDGMLNFDANSGFTFAGWIKTTESYGPIISQRSSTDAGAIIEVVVGYDGAVASAGRLMAIVRQDSGGSGYARITGGSVNNGSWHHFALKRNTSGGIELFLDGVSQGTNSGLESAGAITTNLRALGSERAWVQDSYGTADQRYLNGSIDDVRIYNYALSVAEIQALSNVVDTTPPGAPGTVRDGTGTTDINSTTSRTQLSANWTPSADSESGISGYNYAIGTAQGATNITNGWISNNTNTAVTKTGLTLAVGTTYYFSVKATNGAGLTGTAANSNGQVVLSTAVADTTAPSAPGTVRDGAVAGTDAGFTYSTTTLSANWTASTDNESGITNYQFSIGTTPGGTQTSGWAAIGNVLSVTKTGLTLTAGTTYYFSVKAVNGAGLTGAAANSNGQYVAVINTADTTPPSAVAQVRDGADAGADADVTNLTDELSANWDASADAESGVAKYYYAIGTRPAGTDVASWTDNGQLTEVTHTGLSLAIGATYYFSVKAENGVGMQSAVTNSDGQLVQSQDTQGPLISNVTAQGITQAGATIVWSTDELSTSQVEYGLTVIYGSLTGEYISMNTAHSVTISGLQPQTQYHYRVISRDYAGNVRASVDYTFTTLSTLNTQHSSPAYPNPCDFKNGQVIKFRVGSAGSETGEVNMYTLSGKLVKKLAGTSGIISWDGKNEDGQKVARGIYIYRITESGGETKTGRLAVK